MTRTSPEVFLSYRRSDSAGYSGRLYDGLEQLFGKERIFKDLEAIPSGSNVDQAIQSGIGRADAVLITIGPDWTEPGTDSRPRLFADQDYVRLEVLTALELEKKVIPVLVGGAAMPSEEQIPADLRPLLNINAHELSDARWNYDLAQLAAELTGEEPELMLLRLTGGRPRFDRKPIVALALLVAGLFLEPGTSAVVAVIAGLLCGVALARVRQRKARGAWVAWLGLGGAAVFLVVFLTIWFRGL